MRPDDLTPGEEAQLKRLLAESAHVVPTGYDATQEESLPIVEPGHPLEPSPELASGADRVSSVPFSPTSPPPDALNLVDGAGEWKLHPFFLSPESLKQVLAIIHTQIAADLQAEIERLRNETV